MIRRPVPRWSGRKRQLTLHALHDASAPRPRLRPDLIEDGVKLRLPAAGGDARVPGNALAKKRPHLDKPAFAPSPMKASHE